MTSHFIFVIFFCWSKGTVHEVFWVSHAGSLIDGIGALSRNMTLISVSIVCLFALHMFWLIDSIPWLLFGTFPFGTTTYLTKADTLQWIQSSNHFFSVPAMFVLSVWNGQVKKWAWFWATLLYAVLAVISIFVSPFDWNVD